MTEQATADALIDAAEDLFARDGIEGASLRAVMRAAGSDPGAVHYHFGGRQELAGAVLDRILAPLNAHRLALLAAVVPPASLDELVAALVRPDLEAAAQLQRRGQGRARLIGAVYLSPQAFVVERVEDHFRPVAEAFLPHLRAALPAISADLLAWRVRWCFFGTLGALLWDGTQIEEFSPDELTTRLVSTIAAALAAPDTPKET